MDKTEKPVDPLPLSVTKRKKGKGKQKNLANNDRRIRLESRHFQPEFQTNEIEKWKKNIYYL